MFIFENLSVSGIDLNSHVFSKICFFIITQYQFDVVMSVLTLPWRNFIHFVIASTFNSKFFASFANSIHFNDIEHALSCRILQIDQSQHEIVGVVSPSCDPNERCICSKNGDDHVVEKRFGHECQFFSDDNVTSGTTHCV